MAGLDWSFSHGSAHDIADMMVVMADAFDRAYGEAWTAPQCLGILGMPGTSLLLARVGEAPAAFSLTRMIADEAELLLLAVRPCFARNGIGRGLLLTAMDEARTRGVKIMHLEVRSDNDAVRLYDAVGFSQVGIRPGYYRGNDGKVRDALTYRCLLTDFD